MRPPAATAALLALAALAACSRRCARPDVVTSPSPPLVAVAPALALQAPARVEGRVGAVQLEVRLRNDGPHAVPVVADPWLAELDVRGAAGGAVPCEPGRARGRDLPEVRLAPGATLPLRIDLSARCALAAGSYDVEVAVHAAGTVARARARVDVAERTWVNPGPR